MTGALVRVCLCPFGVLYGLLAAVRRYCFASGFIRSFDPGVPVISIGNLTVGGTGKTPMTLLAAGILFENGRRPAILMRGYAAADPSLSDEALLYRQRIPEVPVYADPDRRAAARRAVDAGADLLLLDDGFQHLRLRRDLDIVLIDARCPFGGGLPLPAGMLREFPSALSQADIVCLTHTTGAPDCDSVQKAVERYATRARILRANHRPDLLLDHEGRPHLPEMIRNRSVLAFSGIGRPDGFRATLTELGAEIIGEDVFPDHHAYTQADVQALLAQAEQADALLVTTEKDRVKLDAVLEGQDASRLYTLRISLCVEPEDVLRDALRRVADTPVPGDAQHD